MNLNLLHIESGLKYSVKADHPILARPDKCGLSWRGAVALANELLRIGYENVVIQEEGQKNLRVKQK